MTELPKDLKEEVHELVKNLNLNSDQRNRAQSAIFTMISNLIVINGTIIAAIAILVSVCDKIPHFLILSIAISSFVSISILLMVLWRFEDFFLTVLNKGNHEETSFWQFIVAWGKCISFILTLLTLLAFIIISSIYLLEKQQTKPTTESITTTLCLIRTQ